MTKIWIMSDLHDDFNRVAANGPLSLPRDVDADVCVIAGDIAGRLAKMGRGWLEQQFRGMPIVVVPGNHDFWRSSIDNEVDKFRNALQSDWIFLLDGDSVVLAGTRFTGGVLWTDYAIAGSTAAGKNAHVSDMNDLRYLKTGTGGGRAKPNHLEAEHWRIRQAIDAELEIPFDGPSVVVTHHAPHLKSLRGGRVTGDLDAAYASDLTSLIERRAPELWIHGHVHERRDYTVGQTRIMCNPKGYIMQAGMTRHNLVSTEVADFDERLVIDIQRRPRIDPYGFPRPFQDELDMWKLSQPIADEDETPAAGRKI